MEFLKYRIIKQLIVNCIWISMGMMLEMISVSLLDLRSQMNISYEEAGAAVGTRAIGLFFGAVAGGFIHEIFYNVTDVLTALGLLLLGLMNLIIPWIHSYAFFVAIMFICGIAKGIINTGGNPIVMYLWGEKAAPPLHSLHFGFGFGALIAAQLARPFLTPTSTNVDATGNATSIANATVSILDANTTSSPVNTSDVMATSQLVYPFSIASAFAALVGISLIAIHIRGTPIGFPKRQPKNKLRELLSPGSCAYGRPLYGTGVLFLVFLFYVFAVGGERAYGGFIFSYAVDADVAFSKDKAAHLLTVFYVSHLSGRFFGIFISHFVPIHWLILGDIIGGLLTMILGASLAYSNEIAIWVTTGLAGAFISVLWPAGMAWTNIHLEPNSMAVMLVMFGSAAGNFSYNYFTGLLFDRYGVVTLMYILLQYSITILVLFVIMQAVVLIFGKPLEPDSDGDLKEDDEETSNTLPLNSLNGKKKDIHSRNSDPEIDPLRV